MQPRVLNIVLLLLLLAGGKASAQEDAEVISYGRRYIDINVRALEKCTRRIERQQERLLNNLQHKEHRLMRKLHRSNDAADSAAYTKLQAQPINYDSIRTLLHGDSTFVKSKVSRRRNAVFDSLRGVETFIQASAAKAHLNEPALNNYSGELAQLQQKTDYQNYVNDLITQHTNSLKGITGNLPGLGSIEKEVFYGKARMKAWQELADNPSKAEEKALEYLQGTPGFDQQLTRSTNPDGNINGNVSAEGLEALGYQTKQQLTQSLQQKFGGNLSQVQQQMTAQLNEWQNKATQIKSQINNAKRQISEAKTDAAHFKSSIKKPVFNKNPMRGLPFWKRIEKSWTWQTTRATADGTPAMLEMAGMAAYRQTPKFSYGIGVSLDFGLGQDWNHIRLSFEGAGFRSFIQYKFIYGIGCYGGYERTYKRAVFSINNSLSSDLSHLTSIHSTQYYSESLLSGLTKTYKVNNRWDGSIQMLYDVWWREKNLKSPIIIRIATNKK